MKIYRLVTWCALSSALVMGVGRILAQDSDSTNVSISTTVAVVDPATGETKVLSSTPGDGSANIQKAVQQAIGSQGNSPEIQQAVQQALNRGGTNRFKGAFGDGNFDPAKFRQEMQQHMLDTYREQLGFTNDVEWDAVKPLVQNVLDARRDVAAGSFGSMAQMFGGRNRRGNGGDGPGGGNMRAFGGGGPGGMSALFGQPDPAAEALQQAADENAPVAQMKDLIAKLRVAKKAKQAKLEAAQDELKQVLDVKQEAKAMLAGLLD